MPFGARVAMIPCAIKLQSSRVAAHERWNFFLRSTGAAKRRRTTRLQATEECLEPQSTQHYEVLGSHRSHLRRTIAEFVAHYHGERNHQGIGHELINRSRERLATGKFAATSGSAAR